MLIIFVAIPDKEKRNRLEELYIEHAPLMYKVAYRILNDRSLAEDAVHEAFINISKCFDKIRKRDCTKSKALLVIIIRNVSIDIFRKRKKQYNFSYEELETEFAEPGPNIEDVIINNEMFNKVAELIKELNPSYADILSLKYFYQYKDEEISQMLNISQENVRVRLYRARQKLLKLLMEREAANNESTKIS